MQEETLQLKRLREDLERARTNLDQIVQRAVHSGMMAQVGMDKTGHVVAHVGFPPPDPNKYSLKTFGIKG